MDLRKVLFASAMTLQPVFVAPVLAATPPDYFFGSWTVTKSCAGPHGGAVAGVEPQSKLSILKQDAADDSLGAAPSQPAMRFDGVTLVYRPGALMSVPPADFACTPGAEAQSSFLAMSGYAVDSEPYYPQAHWYGTATVNGQPEHVLIFPLQKGSPSAIVVLLATPGSVRSNDNGVVYLDDNGVISGNGVVGTHEDGTVSSRRVRWVQESPSNGVIQADGIGGSRGIGGPHEGGGVVQVDGIGGSKGIGGPHEGGGVVQVNGIGGSRGIGGPFEGGGIHPRNALTVGNLPE